MKKVSLILAALALVLGISQCKKQEEPVASGEKQHIVLNASFGGGNSKIADNGTGSLKWTDEDGHKDIIKVYNSSKEDIGTLTCTDAANGTFEGEIFESSGQITFTFGSQLKDLSAYLSQTGKLKDAIYLKGEANYQSSGNYNVTMDMPHAVVKLDLSEFLVSGEANVYFENDGGGAVAGLMIGDDFDKTSCYVAIKKSTIKSVCGEKSGTSAVNWSLEPNSFYTAAGEGGAPTGDAIVIEPATPTTPKFTVDANGKTVEFAPGNLYWDGSAFKFEANQWSTTPASNGTWDDSHVSHFFWSKTASVAYASSYSDSGASTGDVFFTNASDFQVNGETAGTWHTLSNAEWDYLLNSRTNSSSLRAWVTLSDVSVSGLVILPDGSSATASEITTTSKLAEAGAVFLPAAGRRYGEGVNYVGSDYYWSSTPHWDSEGFACYMFFDSGIGYPDVNYRSYGYAVRLVR